MLPIEGGWERFSFAPEQKSHKQPTREVEIWGVFTTPVKVVFRAHLEKGQTASL